MSDQLVVYEGKWLIPAERRAIGVIAGAPGASGLEVDQPAVMVLTDTELQLCNQDGPFFRIPLIGVTDVDVYDFKGLPAGMNSSGGTQWVTPRQNYGVQVTYTGLNSTKRLRVRVFFADSAHTWVAAISKAIDDLDHNVHDKFMPSL
jgi:hypothetical protein